jgi:hypothetical protein
LAALVALPCQVEQEVHPWLALVALVAYPAAQVVRPLEVQEALVALEVLPYPAVQEVHPLEVQEALVA